MTTKRIQVELNEEQVAFIKWLALRDSQSFQEELQTMFYLQLSEDMDYYEESFNASKGIFDLKGEEL